MPNNKPLRLLFVINPQSGVKEKINWEENIRDYFRDTVHEVEIYRLQGGDHTRNLQDNISKFQPDRVIAVGGDGTVKLIAGQLINTSMALHVVISVSLVLNKLPAMRM